MIQHLVRLFVCLLCTWAFSQSGAKVEAIIFKGKITQEVRDQLDVPQGETWMIENADTGDLEMAAGDDLWTLVAPNDGKYPAANVVYRGKEPTAYTPSNASLEGHLEGINGALGSLEAKDILYNGPAPTHYTPLSDDAQGHFQGIDTTLGALKQDSDFDAIGIGDNGALLGGAGTPFNPQEIVWQWNRQGRNVVFTIDIINIGGALVTEPGSITLDLSATSFPNFNITAPFQNTFVFNAVISDTFQNQSPSLANIIDFNARSSSDGTKTIIFQKKELGGFGVSTLNTDTGFDFDNASIRISGAYITSDP